MEINLQEMTIKINGNTEDIFALAKKISTKNVSSVVELLNETNSGLPRILRTRALKMVLNEFVKIAKDLPITTELLHRLNWYTEYSDYQLNKLFNTLASTGDTRFHENACAEQYKISLWILVLVNAQNLNLSEDTIVKLTKLDDLHAQFKDFNELLNGCLYDFSGSIDVVPEIDFSRIMFKSSTVAELREVASKYDINVPKRLNRAQLLEVIVQRLKEDEKYDEGVHEKIKDMKVVSLQRFAKDNDIKASTELRKDAVIDFILKAVENGQTSLRTLPSLNLIVLEEEKFEMKPEYIRDIDSRYYYEFDEDGEIVSKSDIDDLKGEIEKLRLEQEAERERLNLLRLEQEAAQQEGAEENGQEDLYAERVKELEKQIEILNSKQNSEENLSADQEELLKRMLDAKIKEMLESQSQNQVEQTETVVVETVVEEYVQENNEEQQMQGRMMGEQPNSEEQEEQQIESSNNEEMTQQQAEKEAELAEKEAELAQQQAEKEAELAEKEAELQREADARREAEFQNREAELAAKEADIERQAELAAKEAELAQKEVEMHKELEYATKEAELAAKEADIERQAELAQKEAELAAKEADIERQTELALKEAELAQKEAELAQKENDVTETPDTVEPQEEYYQETVVVEEYEQYDDEPVYSENIVYQDEPVYSENIVYQEAPVYSENIVYQEAPVYSENIVQDEAITSQEDVYVESEEIVYEEETTYEDDSVYQEQPVYSENIAYQEASVYDDEVVYDEAPVYSENIVYQEQPSIYSEEIVYQEQPVYSENIVYQEQPIYSENIVYQEQPIYSENIVYQEQPIYSENIVYQEQPIYSENIVYQEQPIYSENIVYQEQPMYQEQVIQTEEVLYQQQPMYQEQTVYREDVMYTSQNNPYAQQAYDPYNNPYASNNIYSEQITQRVEETIDISQYDDPYQYLPPVESVEINQGRVDEVSFISYADSSNYSQSIYDEIYSEPSSNDTYVESTPSNVNGEIVDKQQDIIAQQQQIIEEQRKLLDQEYLKSKDSTDVNSLGMNEVQKEELNKQLQQEMMEKHQDYLEKVRELEQQQIDLDKQRDKLVEDRAVNSISTTTTTVVTTSSSEFDERKARYQQIEEAISALTATDATVVEDANSRSFDAGHLNNLFESNDVSNAGNKEVIEDNDGELVEESEIVDTLDFVDTPIELTYGQMDESLLSKKQKNAKKKIANLEKKKAKLLKYRTIKDSTLVKQYNRNKLLKVLKVVLFILAIIAIYLFVLLGGVYAFESGIKLGNWWSFDPANSFVAGNIKALDTITFGNYQGIYNAFGATYKVIAEFFIKLFNITQ